MKVTLIHGDHVTVSRKRYLQIVDAVTERGWEVIQLAPSSDNLENSLRRQSLFGNQTLYCLDNLANKLSDKDLTWLKTKASPIEANLLIYYEGELAKKYISVFEKSTKVLKIEKYDLPKLIFKFLDSLFPGNNKTSLEIFHQVLLSEPVEFVFALMATLLRDLYWVKISPQTINFPPWRLSRLKKQASFYTLERLTKIINNLASVDLNVKLSKVDLIQSLDLIIMRDLQ